MAYHWYTESFTKLLGIVVDPNGVTVDEVYFSRDGEFDETLK
jgi:hypothetical protein